MKKIIVISALLGTLSVTAQEHFAGISTSLRTGILNGTVNPAALANLTETFSFNVLSASAYMSNNKMGFSELITSNDFEHSIFSGNKPASVRADFEVLGPSVAWKVDKWVFALTTSGKTKANIININNDLGNAIVNGALPESVETAATVLVDYNQKASAITWGEIGFSVARQLYSENGHTLNGGVTVKLLMPGTNARMNASNFSGTLAYHNNSVALTDAYSNVSFAYSGALKDDFNNDTNFVDYFGKPGGVSADVGINYNWKPDEDKLYKVNAGIALRNMGSMTYSDPNNQSNSYIINVPEGQYLDLQQFAGDDDLESIEQKLVNSGFAQIVKQNTDFKVKTPATLAVYADAQVYGNLYLGAYIQRKLNQDYKQNQISVQNVFTVTPRYATQNFEAFMPVSSSEISGFAMGLGLRYRGFYIGSGSVITAVFNNTDTHQADAYAGFRFSL
ncbi:hypothetical protein ACLI1A_16110 [Flavobacterium sp. RHBU_3]|uniref:hypothetical protein n=1 Tax=Flavobacterium sp. RHBU_3 TaxID=3391184 RepID=UPI0039856964